MGSEAQVPFPAGGFSYLGIFRPKAQVPFPAGNFYTCVFLDTKRVMWLELFPEPVPNRNLFYVFPPEQELAIAAGKVEVAVIL